MRNFGARTLQALCLKFPVPVTDATQESQDSILPMDDPDDLNEHVKRAESDREAPEQHHASIRAAVFLLALTQSRPPKLAFQKKAQPIRSQMPVGIARQTPRPKRTCANGSRMPSNPLEDDDLGTGGGMQSGDLNRCTPFAGDNARSASHPDNYDGDMHSLLMRGLDSDPMSDSQSQVFPGIRRDHSSITKSPAAPDELLSPSDRLRGDGQHGGAPEDIGSDHHMQDASSPLEALRNDVDIQLQEMLEVHNDRKHPTWTRLGQTQGRNTPGEPCTISLSEVEELDDLDVRMNDMLREMDEE